MFKYFDESYKTLTRTIGSIDCCSLPQHTQKNPFILKPTGTEIPKVLIKREQKLRFPITNSTPEH